MYLNCKDDKALKILVVEDEHIVALDITRTLRKLGFSPLKVVSTGESALKSVQELAPDLVILDIKLKGKIDGIETAEKIRQLRSTPYIYFSSYSDSITLERVKKTKPYGYILKNSNSIDLYTTIKMAIQRFSIEKENHKREELLSVTMKSITDAVIGLNKAGEIILWNKGAENIFLWCEPEILGINIGILIPDYIPNEFPEIIEDMSVKGIGSNFESIFKKKDNTIVSGLVTISPVHEYNGAFDGLSLVIKDISERKNLEKQIIDVMEKERFRIGRELHDNLGQYLTGILLKLKALENSLIRKKLKKETELVLRIASYVKISLEKTREISRGLVPSGLEKVSLIDALNSLASSYEDIQNIQITCQFSIDEDIMDYRIIAQLYHISQEAITNAVKHSGCTGIVMELSCNETEVIMKVVDNGKGIGIVEGNGLGLRIMKYRADIIHGRLHIYQSGKSGTTVSCSIPKAVLKGK